MHSALQLGEHMWGVTEDRWSVNANRFVTAGQKTPAAPNTENGPAGEADGRQRKKKKEKAHILVYQEVSPAKEQKWFRKLLDPKQTKEVPKPEQERFLRTVAHRCQYEASVQKMTVEKREAQRFRATTSVCVTGTPRHRQDEVHQTCLRVFQGGARVDARNRIPMFGLTEQYGRPH